MILRLVIPLLATIVIELGVLLFLRERRRRVLWGSVELNILTNVPLNLYAVYVGAGLTMVGVGEMLVILVEALGYWWLIRDLHRAVAYSFLCNAISFLLGEWFLLLYLL